MIPRLMVPRTRKCGFRTKVFHRYKRRWKEVDEWIRGVFIAGVSTRELGWFHSGICQVPSAGTQSVIRSIAQILTGAM